MWEGQWELEGVEESMQQQALAREMWTPRGDQ